MFRTVVREISRCTRHQRWHRSLACPDCTRHAAALRQADELTKRAAREAADVRAEAAAMHELADDIEAMRAIRHFNNASDAIQRAFFAAMTGGAQ